MVTGILNARQHFLAPALAPLIYNLSIIAGALLLASPFGVRGLAAGVVLGSLGHLLVQLPALRAIGMRWTPTLDLASPGVREVARLMGPRVIGLAAAQLNFIIVVFFASYVSDEAISALTYAFLIAMLPVGVVGMVGTGLRALLPSFHGFTFFVSHGMPKSRGTVKLRSADPVTPPLIVSEAQIGEIFDKVAKVIKAVK